MEQKAITDSEKLTSLQIELLKGLRYITTEKQLEDVRRMLGDYFATQLDASIEKVETERGYTASTYESWANKITHGNEAQKD